VLLLVSFQTAEQFREAFAAYNAHKRYALVLSLISMLTVQESSALGGQPESEGIDESVVGRPANLQPQHKLPRLLANEDGEIFWCVTRRERKDSRKKASEERPRAQENPQDSASRLEASRVAEAILRGASSDEALGSLNGGGLHRGNAMQDQVKIALATALPAMAEQAGADLGAKHTDNAVFTMNV
jgi:hypothetical protein